MINKKGFTLIELIVSITLISVIMIFMFSFLSDITFEKDNENYASKNQAIRQEITSIISKAARYNYELDEGDEYVNPLKTLKINGTEMVNTNKTLPTSQGDTTTIVFGDNKSHNHTLVVDKKNNQFRFTSAENYKYAWTLKQGKIHSTVCTSKVSGQTTLVECIVKIFTDNDNNNLINIESVEINNNNCLDDFIFDFMIKKS